MDTPTKEEIKTWLDQKDDGYMWLAKELAVSYQTVRAWMSTRAIPQKKLERIAELMRSPEEEQKKKAFAIMMLESDYNACERAAYNAGVSLVDWATSVLVEAAFDAIPISPKPQENGLSSSEEEAGTSSSAS